MAKYTKQNFSLLIFAFFSILAFLYGCAAMQNPQGGPKDTQPPKILKMEPKDLTTNFKSKEIVIEFDEYFKLNNQYKEFSVSPDLEKLPILKVKKRRLEIILPDTLEKNTTYTLNFGKMIADINESNEVKNLTYVFSTGPVLDSLTINGNVKNSLTGKPELDALVFILPVSRDTIFGKKRPSIYALTDSNGNYSLKNLRKDSYRLYAIKEQGGGDKIYQQQNDEVGFFTDTIHLTKNVDSANVQLFKELPTNFRIKDKKISPEGIIVLSWNQNLKSPSITITNPKNYDVGKIVKFNKTNDSASIWLPQLDFDSLQIAVNSMGKSLDTVKVSRGKKESYTNELKATDNLENGTLNPNKSLKLTFNYPINNLDVNKITLLEDSIPRKGLIVEKDSSDALSLRIGYKWKEKSNYILNFKPGAVTGMQKSSNKDISKQFTLGNKDDYGTLVLNVEVPDTTAKYILEVVNDKKDAVISAQVLRSSQKVIFANYKAGTYYVRVTYDVNKNDIWDTGNVSEHRQPEKIWYASKELSIRANWERNETLAIPKLIKTN